MNTWSKIKISTWATSANISVNDAWIGTAGEYQTNNTTLTYFQLCGGSTSGINDQYYVDNVNFTDY